MTQFNMISGGQEGPDPKRLLLAVIASSAVLMLYSYFFAPKPEIVSSPIAVESKEQVLEKPFIKDPEVVHEGFTKEQAVVKKSFVSKDKDNNRTSYEVELNNHGGLIDHYVLTDFSQEQVLLDEDKLGSSLLRLSLKNASAIVLEDNAPYEIESLDDSHIVFKHVTKDGLEIKRYYQFRKDAVIEEKISFKNLSLVPLKLEPILMAVKKDEVATSQGFFSPDTSGKTLAFKSDKHQKFSYGDLTQPKILKNPKYIALDDQFFLVAIVPQYQDLIDQVELVVQNDPNNEKKKIAIINMNLKPSILMQGEEKSLTHQFFMGPKQVDLLGLQTIPLDENIDFGWFGILSRPMLWLLVKIYSFVHNYGLAIILITFIIKLLTYPLTQKSFSSQQEMKKLQPKIKELQQKFGHDRTVLGQKQMELYRTHGINPLAGCLPLLIQLPIWFAFFQMLRNSVELFDQPFYGWIVDLTKPDPYYVLPVLMGVSMLIQQMLTPPPSDQPQMKYVMWAMPIFLTFIMLNMPSGLSLYILTNNLLTIFQQIIIKKQSEKISAKI